MFILVRVIYNFEGHLISAWQNVYIFGKGLLISNKPTATETWA